MTSARIVLLAVLLAAATLTGCVERDDPDPATTTSAGPADLRQVRDTCLEKVAKNLAEFTDELAAEQFFVLSEDDRSLRVVTPEPVGDVTRSEALNAAICVFEAAGAPHFVVRELSVPKVGPKTDSWPGFRATWQSDSTVGYRAVVTRD